jgi:hypothetical protein
MSLSLFRLRHTLLLGLVAATLAALLAPRPVAAQTGERCFAETGYCISGPIRAYWERNGGLATFGFPISAERRQTIEGSWTGPVQWFERDRLEDHSNEGLGVLAGRLGARALELQGLNWQALPGDNAVQPGCRFFRETQFNLCGPFLRYWEQNGGLERFGFPLTREREETIEGRAYTVQYFERRRMELHPENAGTPYEVLLGLLGRDVFRAEGDQNLAPIAAGDLSADVQQAVLDAAHSRLRQEYSSGKLALGLADVIEGYALVIANPVGRAPLYVYLTRQSDGWRVLAFTQQPGSDRARRAGFPEQLLGAGDRAAILLQLAQLQSLYGSGLNAYITRPRIAGDFARFWVVPAASENLDPASTFFRRVNGVWVFSTAGTAFPEEQLQQEGVPPELWPYGESVRGPQ